MSMNLPRLHALRKISSMSASDALEYPAVQLLVDRVRGRKR